MHDEAACEHVSQTGPWFDTTPPHRFIPSQRDQSPRRIQRRDLLAQELSSRIQSGSSPDLVLEDMELTPAIAGRRVRQQHGHD
jgi:hypothetical protein